MKEKYIESIVSVTIRSGLHEERRKLKLIIYMLMRLILRFATKGQTNKICHKQLLFTLRFPSPFHN